MPPRPIADSLVPSYWGPLSLTRPRHLWGACLNEKVRPSHFSSLSTSSRWCPSPGTRFRTHPPASSLAALGRVSVVLVERRQSGVVQYTFGGSGRALDLVGVARASSCLLSGQWPRWVWPVSCWPSAPPGRARSSPAPTGSHVSHT